MKELPDVFVQTIQDILTNTIRDISGKTKGWVCNALYIALLSFFKYETFQDAVDFVIHEHPKSDCDTNACITGALYGALLGYDKLKLEDITYKNIISMKENNTILQEFDKLIM